MSVETREIPRLKKRYREEIKPALQDEFKYALSLIHI